MKTACVEATFLSELRFMLRCITSAALGDTLLVILMIAALFL